MKTNQAPQHASRAAHHRPHVAPRISGMTAIALAAATLCAIAPSAHAQASVPSAPASAASAPLAASPNDGTKLQTVVVTANKREQATIDVPASVSTIPAERLTEQGLSRMEDYEAQVSGLSIVQVTRGETVVVLRGIGTGGAQTSPTTAQYIDDAPVGSVSAYAAGTILTPDLDPSDLRRVEVLKGPQGTLYGAGAVGGLVRYVTVPANSDTFEGVVSVGGNKVTSGGYGNNERVALNIPLVKDSLGLRVSAFDRDEAGYIYNPVDGKSNTNRAITRGGRVALDWKLDANWSVKTWALTQKFKADGDGAEDVLAPSLTPLPGPPQRVSYIPETQDISLDLVNTTVSGWANGINLVSSTTWQDSTASSRTDVTRGFTALLQAVTGVPGLGAEADESLRTRRWSQELRAHGDAFNEKLDYDFGAFFTNEGSSSAPTAPAPFIAATDTPLPLPPLESALIASKYEEYSLYGNGTYALSSMFDVMAGLRLSRDKQHFDQDYEPSILSPLTVNVVQDSIQHESSWMLGGRFKPSTSAEVYARAATGYRPGGPSGLPPGTVPGGKSTFDPDSLTSYELGYKAELLGGKASIESALFVTDWRHIQAATTAATPTFNYSYFVNGGTAKSQGAEATLAYAPVNGLTLRANGAYTDARLTSDAPAAHGLNGDRLPYTPRWSGSIGSEYSFALSPTVQAWVGTSLNFIGERRSDFSDNKPIDVPGYRTFNVNTGFEMKGVRISLYGKNLTNSRGINSTGASGDQFTGTNPSGNPYYASIIQPRTIGLDLSYRL